MKGGLTMTCIIEIPLSQVNLVIAIAKKYHVLVDTLYEDDLYSHLELIGTRKNIEKTIKEIHKI